MQPVRTFLVEDSAVICENLAAALEELAPVTVIGTAPDESGAARRLRQLGSDVDLIIIDIFLQSGSGLGVLRDAVQDSPAAKRVVLSNYASPAMRRRCTALGAHRVFDKSNEIDDLIAYCIGLGNDTLGVVTAPLN